MSDNHTGMSDARGPDVRIPPPLLFVAGWLAGWWLDRRLVFEIDGGGAGVVQTSLGGLMAAVGLVLMWWGMTTFIRARTSILPRRPARALVRGGPYGWSRNPMYLGLTVAYVGLAVLANRVWPLVWLPVVLIVLTTAVIRREEAYLRGAFGEAYEAYRRQVRRWV